MARKYERLEKDLKSGPLEFKSVEDDVMDVVDTTQPPTMMAEFFYEMAEGRFPKDSSAYARPPDQRTFAQAFYHSHADQGANTFTEEYKDGWIRRCQVTWPSLVRDMHFVYLLQSHPLASELESVEYDLQKDIKEGVDAIVTHDGKTYYVNLFVDTDKSHRFLDQKKSSRHPSHNATEIHIEASRNDSRKKELRMKNGRSLWLYSDGHIEELLEQLE